MSKGDNSESLPDLSPSEVSIAWTSSYFVQIHKKNTVYLMIISQTNKIKTRINKNMSKIKVYSKLLKVDFKYIIFLFSLHLTDVNKRQRTGNFSGTQALIHFDDR